MDMANLGAMEVVNLLSDQDEIAVIAVDSAPHVVVPRTSAANARGQSRRILGIESMGGGIFVYEGLVAGLKEVSGSSAGVRHIVLFSDAADAEEPGKYKELLANAAGAGMHRQRHRPGHPRRTATPRSSRRSRPRRRSLLVLGQRA